MFSLDAALPEIDAIIADAVRNLSLHGLDLKPAHGDIHPAPESNPYHVTDLTYLKPHGGSSHIQSLCRTAVEVQAKTVCVHPIHLKLALSLLHDTPVKAIIVQSFPYGTSDLEGLMTLLKHDFSRGASEIDIVFPHHFITSDDYLGAFSYLSALRACVPGVIKVILETSEHSKTQIAMMSLLVQAVGLNFVKTSTGFASGGATCFDVALMRRCVGPDIGVKASGGIKTVQAALELLACGASRIGASSLSGDTPAGY